MFAINANTYFIVNTCKHVLSFLHTAGVAYVQAADSKLFKFHSSFECFSYTPNVLCTDKVDTCL